MQVVKFGTDGLEGGARAYNGEDYVDVALLEAGLLGQEGIEDQAGMLEFGQFRVSGGPSAAVAARVYLALQTGINAIGTGDLSRALLGRGQLTGRVWGLEFRLGDYLNSLLLTHSTGSRGILPLLRGPSGLDSGRLGCSRARAGHGSMSQGT